MVEEINSTIGISREPIATPEKVRDMLQADTIHRQDYEIRRNIGRHGRGEED
jgi:hypothetical protein